MAVSTWIGRVGYYCTVINASLGLVCDIVETTLGLELKLCM